MSLTLEIPDETRHFYQQQQSKVRQLQLLRFIADAQKGTQARLGLRSEIERMINIMALSIHYGANHAEVVSLTLIMGYWAVRWGHTASWQRFMQYAYHSLIKQKDPQQMSQFYRIYSFIHQYQGNLPIALENARKAYEYSQQTNDLFARKDAISCYSQICLQLNTNLLAIDNIQQKFWQYLLTMYGDVHAMPPDIAVPIIVYMIETGRKNKDIDRVIQGSVHLFVIDFDADALDPDHWDYYNRAKWFHNTGLFAGWMLGDYVRAETDLQNASQLFGRVGDKNGEARARCDLGLAYIEIGDLKRAQMTISQSYSIAKSYCTPHTQTNITGNMGMIYLMRGKIDEATQYLFDYVVQAQNLGLNHDYLRAHILMSYVYALQGDYAEAHRMSEIGLNGYAVEQNESYARSLSNHGLINYLMGRYDDVKICIEKLECWQTHYPLFRQRIEVNRLRLLGLLAHRVVLPDPSPPTTYYEQALALEANPFMQAILYLDLWHLGSAQARPALWHKARQLLKQAGATALLDFSTASPLPHLFF